MTIFRPSVLLIAILAGSVHAAPASLPNEARLAPHEVSASTAGSIDLWALFKEAREADTRVLSAQAKARSSEYQEREAFGQLLPQLGVASSFSRTAYETKTIDAEYNGERYNIGLSQVLYNPEAWHNYRRFSTLTKRQQADTENVMEATAVDLVERYFAALAAEDERELVAAELKATEGNLRRVESMFKRQLAVVTDVLEITARVDGLKAKLIEAENGVSVSREKLSEVVGRPITEKLKRIGSRPTFSMPSEPADHWVDSALGANPALMALGLAAQAAEDAVRQAKSGHKPTVSLNLTGQRSDIGYENSQTPRTDTYVATVAVEIPLYSGGSTSARVAATHEQQMAAQHDYESARRQVVRETRTAYYDTQASLSRIAAGRTAQASAEKARLAAERAFELGVMNAVDILNAIQDEYRARRDLQQAQYNFVLSSILLRRWSGTLVDDDIRKASEWLDGEGASLATAQR